MTGRAPLRRGLLWGLIAGLLAVGYGCQYGYRFFAGPVKPAESVRQMSGTRISDDGTVTFVQDRLEIGVRPMTDDELNRQFASASMNQAQSTNPYTYGNWRPWGEKRAPSRFTVFLATVKNYAYPKIQIDPLRATLIAKNGREYKALSLLELEEYYSPYRLAYAGNLYARYDERIDILRSTMYTGIPVFSGQEDRGYIVFPNLDHDVDDFSVRLKQVVLRFDFRNEPVETIDVAYHFHRDLYKARRPRTE